jgi:hypothetical protein
MGEHDTLSRNAVVGETVYRVGYPVRTARLLLLLAICMFGLSPSWPGLAGVGMVVLETVTASPTFNIGNGCLLTIVCATVVAVAPNSPYCAPILAWGSAAWFLGGVECRLTMVPDPDFAGQRHAGQNISALGVGVLLLTAAYLCWRFFRGAA